MLKHLKAQIGKFVRGLCKLATAFGLVATLAIGLRSDCIQKLATPKPSEHLGSTRWGRWGASVKPDLNMSCQTSLHTLRSFLKKKRVHKVLSSKVNCDSDVLSVKMFFTSTRTRNPTETKHRPNTAARLQTVSTVRANLYTLVKRK